MPKTDHAAPQVRHYGRRLPQDLDLSGGASRTAACEHPVHPVHPERGAGQVDRVDQAKLVLVVLVVLVASD